MTSPAPVTAPRDPEEVIRTEFGGPGRPGDDVARRVLLALSTAGWRLVHGDACRELVSYRLKPTDPEAS